MNEEPHLDHTKAPRPENVPARQPAQDIQFRVPQAQTGGWFGGIITLLYAAGVVALANSWLVGAFAPPGGPLVTAVLALFGPAVVGLGIVGFALWLFVPDRTAPPILLGVLALLALWRWGPTWSAEPATLVHPAKVATWNVQRLWHDPDARSCVTDTLRAINADVLVLQEISERDLTPISTDLGLNCKHAPYRAEPESSGGIAICWQPSFHLDSFDTRTFPEQDWHFAEARLIRDDRTTTFRGVHLTPWREIQTPKEPAAAWRWSAAAVDRRWAQANALAGEPISGPTVVLGDFNTTRDDPVHALMRSSYLDAFEQGGSGTGATTWPTSWLPLRVDYVYASPEIPIGDTQVHPSECSNHKPVVSLVDL